MTRSKEVGTQFESDVVRFLRANGFPQAERRALHGTADLGDITGIPGVAIECKGGKAAETASDGQVLAWLGETETERRNAGSDVGVLVVKRKGVGSANAGRWWAVMDLRTILVLVLGKSLGPLEVDAPVWMHLDTATSLLAEAGYGEAGERSA